MAAKECLMGLLSWMLGKKDQPEADKPSSEPSQAAPRPPQPKKKDYDQAWRELVAEGIRHAAARDWGFYASTRFNMAKQLREEGKNRQSLEMYLEVCYLDLNDPGNNGIPWSPRTGVIPPVAVEEIGELAAASDLGLAELEVEFIAIGNRVQSHIRTPLAPEKAWLKLCKALEPTVAANSAEAAARRAALEAAKESRILERQATRDAKRAGKEALKALERERKATVRQAEREAKRLDAATANALGKIHKNGEKDPAGPSNTE